jgi:hypothetical protein
MIPTPFSSPADALEPVGDDWSLVYWNPEIGEYLDSIDDDDLIVREVERPVGLVDSVTGSEA